MRSVVARWPRLVLTALAIVASTSFLSGTFIFRDTIERTFDALFADVYERVDGFVQSSNSVENLFGLERRDRLPSSIIAEIEAVPGVADAQASIQGDAVVISKDGKPIERPTAPTFGAAINEGDLSVWRVAEGRLPIGGDEVVLERLTADDGGFVLGDDVKVNADNGSRTFTLVGIVEYDDIIAPGNATWALFDEPTAEEFIAKPGFVDAVLVPCRWCRTSATRSIPTWPRPSPPPRSPSRPRPRSRPASASSPSSWPSSRSSRWAWACS